MIIYNGIKIQNKVHFLSFVNEIGETVLIPISKQEAQRISLNIDKISTADRKLVERQNDEEID